MVPEERSTHEGRHFERYIGDGISGRMQKETVPLETKSSKADQGKENHMQVVTEISKENKHEECRSGKEGHNEKENKITKPIREARYRNQNETGSYLLSFEEDLNQDCTYFSDELLLEALSNEIDGCDFLSDGGLNESIRGEEKCTFGGGDEKTVTDDGLFVPLSLVSDEDGDRQKAVRMRVHSSSTAAVKKGKAVPLLRTIVH